MPCLRPGFSSQRSPKAHPSVPPHRHLQPGSTRLFRRLSPLPFVSQKISRIVSRKTATRFVSQEIAITHFQRTTCGTHNCLILGKCVHQKSRQRPVSAPSPLQSAGRTGMASLRGRGWGEGATSPAIVPSPRPWPHSQVLTDSRAASGERGQSRTGCRLL